MKKSCILHWLVFVVILVSSTPSPAQHTILNKMKAISTLANLPNVELVKLTETPGGESLQLLKIGKFIPGTPAIFVAANMEGNRPTSVIAATWLANELVTIGITDSLNWYILPCGNIDALIRSSQSPKCEYTCNLSIVNNDRDDQTDEDACDDLNNDGYLMQMLVKHPQGEYIKDTADTRIIRKAKTENGEKGIYKLYTEGLDNDADGEYNEDGIGGVNINRNFPYLHEFYKPEHGKWIGSEPEVFSLMKFFAEHPEIAMVVTIGEHDNLLFPPEKGKGDSDDEKLKVPGYYAERFDLDAKKMYSIPELKKALSEQVPDIAQQNSMLLSLKNKKEPKSIQTEDIEFYTSISKQYKEHLKNLGVETNVHKTNDWYKGSFEQFAYYQYGLPTFSMSLWNLPKAEKEDKDKTYDQCFLEYADSNTIEAFVKWHKVDHPDFEEVEVGGFIPFVKSSPPMDSLQKIVNSKLPFIIELSKKLPVFEMQGKSKKTGEGIYEVEVYITNKGALPYPTYMGQRNRKPAPIILVIENEELTFLSGLKRTPIGAIGSMETVKHSFLINTNAQSIAISLESKNILTKNANLKIEL